MELVIFECVNETDMLSDMMIIVYEITAGNTIKPKKKKEGRVPPNDNAITRAESEQQEGKKTRWIDLDI